MKPALLLLPNLITDHKYHEPFLPASVDKAVSSLDGLIAESEKGGRRFLSRFETKKPTHLMPLALYNKNTPENELDFLLEPIHQGQRWGIVSDGGLPCIADPGALLVKRARETGVAIQAFVGPSSIMMSLMLSGFSGQHFSFHGYLDKDPSKRNRQIKDLEKKAKSENSTEIFIEAPHRNQYLLEMLVDTLKDSTKLCVAWELTSPDQGVLSQTLRVWKKSPLPQIHKKNAIFLINNS